MEEYEYKKVEGMSVTEVVQMMCDGEDFYRHTAGNEVVINTSKCGIFIGSDCVEMDFESLRIELNDGRIYTRAEKPWWVGCEGMPVMTCLGMAILDKYVDGKTPFHTNLGRFNDARPLTSAERDAIKVKD